MIGPDSGDRPLVALTGATGFLGSHIADVLLAGGYRVRASVRSGSDQRWLVDKPIDIRWVPLGPEDPPDHPDLEQFVTGASAVVHCAGVTRSPDAAGFEHGNVETTRRLLAAAGRRPEIETFLLISSLAAAGPAPPEHPRREEHPPQPLTAYGRSKLAAEKLLAGPGLPFRTVVLRPPALYGPRDRAFLPLFKMARTGWIARLGRHVRGVSLVDGRDVARAVAVLLRTDTASGPYFIDDGHVYTWQDIADALATARGRRVRVLTIPWGLFAGVMRLVGSRLAGRSSVLHPGRLVDLSVAGWVCSGEKLRSETGFYPTRDLRNGFTDTLVSYRSLGWIK